MVKTKLTNDQSEIINQSQLEQNKQNLLQKKKKKTGETTTKRDLKKSLEEVCFLAKIEKNETNIPMAQINSSPIR